MDGCAEVNGTRCSAVWELQNDYTLRVGPYLFKFVTLPPLTTPTQPDPTSFFCEPPQEWLVPNGTIHETSAVSTPDVSDGDVNSSLGLSHNQQIPSHPHQPAVPPGDAATRVDSDNLAGGETTKCRQRVRLLGSLSSGYRDKETLLWVAAEMGVGNARSGLLGVTVEAGLTTEGCVPVVTGRVACK